MGQYPLLRCGDATIGPFSSGAVVRGSGSAQWWERAGAEAVRMGLLGRSGAGACPDLLQRRSGPGEAANESAEYQRFFSRAPARSGPLQQIWTNGAPRTPARTAAAAITPTPGRRDAHFALERALLTAHLESEMHISTSTGPTRPQRPGRPRPVVGPLRGEDPAAAGSGAERRPAPAHADGVSTAAGPPGRPACAVVA